MKTVAKLQQTEKGTARYGPTKFADLTEQEFKQYVGKPWKEVKNFNTMMKKADIPKGSVPESFDWRDHGAVTPVKNQVNFGRLRSDHNSVHLNKVRFRSTIGSMSDCRSRSLKFEPPLDHVAFMEVGYKTCNFYGHSPLSTDSKSILLLFSFFLAYLSTKCSW